MSTTAIVSTAPPSAVPAYAVATPVAASAFADSIDGAAFEQNSAQAQDASSGGYRPGPVPGSETEILTFGRISFSGAAGAVLIGLQVDRSALPGAVGLEADHGIATYRFTQSLVPDTNGATLGTVDNPHMPHMGGDELRLAA